MFDLNGKIALITGAASGIGEAMAFTFAKQGSFVYVADIDEQNGERVVAGSFRESGAANYLNLNIANDAECMDAARKVHDEHGKLDILVNNAGIGHVGTIEQTTVEDMDRLWSINVRGMFALTKAFI